jgi:hypothetical protein
MEQLNSSLPMSGEENSLATENSLIKKESLLFNKVRKNFGYFGSISLIFGILFTFFFYKTGLGINITFFTISMVILLSLIMKKLNVAIKKFTYFNYIAVILLGISSAFTSSDIIQFLNLIGILLLLALSLIHQFFDDSKWDLAKSLFYLIKLPFLCIAMIAAPIVDCVSFLKETKLFKNDKFRNISLGFLIALPLLWIIVGLLSSADLLFGKITGEVYDLLFSSNIFYIIIMTLFGFLACYCIICGSVLKSGEEDKWKAMGKGDASIAITAVTLLGIVYAVFCGIQLIYLFSNGLFVLPVEFTFAEYARRGFFELLVVTVINIMLMIICTMFFKESKVLRFLLTFMTICTYIMIGSATYRMLLYIGAYNLTFLRLFVLLFLLIDTFVLAGVIISVYHKEFPLFKYCVTVITISYIAFSLAKPDYFIASYHVNNKEKLNMDDIYYMTRELSLDAAPVVYPYITDEKKWSDITFNFVESNDDIVDNETKNSYIESYKQRIENWASHKEIRDFNFSIYNASKLLNNK